MSHLRVSIDAAVASRITSCLVESYPVFPSGPQVQKCNQSKEGERLFTEATLQVDARVCVAKKKKSNKIRFPLICTRVRVGSDEIDESLTLSSSSPEVKTVSAADKSHT